MLGPVGARVDDVPIDLGGPRRRALLALLLLHANEARSRAQLIDGLWGEAAPEQAANALQVQVHGLRKALGADRIETVGSGYRVVVDSDELDLTRFDDLVRTARHQEPEDALKTLREALSLWHGAPL